MECEQLCYVVILQKLPLQSVQLKLCHCISLPFQFKVNPETTMRVTNDTLTISGLGLRGDGTVQVKDADPNELQRFIEKMPATVKGKSVKYNFSKLFLVLE